MTTKTAEAAYIYFKLDKMFYELEERIVPKSLRKLQPIGVLAKALVEGRVNYSWTF